MQKEIQTNHPVLVIYKGVLAGSRWPVSVDSLTLGRAEDCDIVLPERRISRYHARIERDASGYLLRDLGSRNGTSVNGEVVRELPYRLRDSDEIELAGILQLGFVASDATLPLSGFLGERDAPIGDELAVSTAARQVSLGRAVLDPPLSPAQFALLTALVDAAGTVVTREQAVAVVWPEATGGVTDQALDALVYRLRERLAELDARHSYIVTVRGHGFRYERPNR